MYDSTQGWVDLGQLQGPTGSTGKSAYNAAVDGGYTGNEDTFNSQMSLMPTHISDTNNPHSVDKHQIGLSNVDDTSDLDKPISKATQEALDKLQESSVPAVTSEDNGKFLRVVDGIWAVSLVDNANGVSF